MVADAHEMNQGEYPKFIRMKDGTHRPVSPPSREYLLMTPEERRAHVARLLTPIVTYAAIDFRRDVRDAGC